jgi:hypothetical protein
MGAKRGATPPTGASWGSSRGTAPAGGTASKAAAAAAGGGGRSTPPSQGGPRRLTPPAAAAGNGAKRKRDTSEGSAGGYDGYGGSGAAVLAGLAAAAAPSRPDSQAAYKWTAEQLDAQGVPTTGEHASSETCLFCSVCSTVSLHLVPCCCLVYVLAVLVVISLS